MQRKAVLVLAGSLGAVGLALVGCDDSSHNDHATPGERVEGQFDYAGEKIEQGARKTGEALNSAAQKSGDVARDLVDQAADDNEKTEPATRPAEPSSSQ